MSVSKLAFEPYIYSFTYWRSTTEPLRHRYQLRIKPSSHTSTQDSRNVMYTFTILKRATQQVNIQRGRTVTGISGSLIRSKTLMELIFNPRGEIR